MKGLQPDPSSVDWHHLQLFKLFVLPAPAPQKLRLLSLHNLGSCCTTSSRTCSASVGDASLLLRSLVSRADGVLVNADSQ